MNVRVYLTDLPLPASEVHPIAFVPDEPAAGPPRHPDGLLWRYWVTTDSEDTLLRPLRSRIESDIERGGHCIIAEPLDRLLSPLPLTRFRNGWRGNAYTRASGDKGAGKARPPAA